MHFKEISSHSKRRRRNRLLAPGVSPGIGVSIRISPRMGRQKTRNSAVTPSAPPGLAPIKYRKPRAHARGYILPRLRRFTRLHYYLICYCFAKISRKANRAA